MVHKTLLFINRGSSTTFCTEKHNCKSKDKKTIHLSFLVLKLGYAACRDKLVPYFNKLNNTANYFKSLLLNHLITNGYVTEMLKFFLSYLIIH